jgi:hypothetical protein
VVRLVSAARLIARCALVVLALAAATIHVPRAHAATPCWKTLLNDWYDGRIDGTYPVHCYRDALKHLPADVQTYSSAHDDILRALQSAIAKERKTGKKVGPNTLVPAPGSSGGGGKGGSGRPGSGGGGGSGSGGSGGSGTVTSPTSTGTGTTGTGRKTGGGLTGIADKAGNSGASGVPVPLLVLGGLALLLLAAGAAGLVAKRGQARRGPPAV